MERINIDEKWTFRRGFLDSLGALEAAQGQVVDLPHDAMIGTAVSPDAPALYDSGYFKGDTGNYTKYVMIPNEWENESIGLHFDGAMMHTVVEVNGCKVASHHYGYSSFYVDITDYVTFGEENRITVHYNTGIQPSSRWYTGSGIYRSVELCHSPRVHVVPDGIYVYTKEVSDGIAFLEAQIDIANDSSKNRLVNVTLEIFEATQDDSTDGAESVAKVSRVIQVNPSATETAFMAINLKNPVLWDLDTPNLYKIKVTATDTGEYRTHFIKSDVQTVDTAETLFGVRTVTVDSVRGLRINGKSVKLKGGCLHHDNGLLGAVSLYESEARKVRKLKEVGFNAIRTTHNPPSAALIEACDRIGMYVFDEAFDAWGVAKRPGDYSNYFDYEWENDLTAFIRRDRVHPSVIMWSIGNEIPERGGLNNGYTIATKLAKKVKELDISRPVSNGICSYWGGMDDYLAKNQNNAQNTNDDSNTDAWEKKSEPFTNGLDVVGYNYLEECYDRDHELYPERVMLGSENFPQEIGYRWPEVEAHSYIIGDFTWTAWDYIGEAGIGKAFYFDKYDPMAQRKPWELMPPVTSYYPWRTANDADYDITGRILPQGEYRSVVWGSKSTHLYSMHPDTYGKVEVMIMWGFPSVRKDWNYAGYENKPIELVVFSNGDEVELIINGQSVGRKAVNKAKPEKQGDAIAYSAKFETVYTPGVAEAVSYKDGVEISRDVLTTTKAAADIVITPEKTELSADGHDVLYVGIDIVDEDGMLIPEAAVELSAEVEGAGYLAGFGSGNTITDEDYTDDKTVTYRGHAMAIVRSGYESGELVIKVRGNIDGKIEKSVKVCVK